MLTIDVTCERVLARIKHEKTLTEETLLLLHVLFDRVAIAALDLVDRHQVRECVSTSGRVAYEVAGQSQKYYLCLLDVGYCNCAYFAHNVLVSKQTSLCKHLLSVKLALALDQLDRISMTDDAWFDWFRKVTN